jgi:hypothetical protein
VRTIKVTYVSGTEVRKDVLDLVIGHEINANFFVIKCASGELYMYNTEFIVTIDIEDVAPN